MCFQISIFDLFYFQNVTQYSRAVCSQEWVMMVHVRYRGPLPNETFGSGKNSISQNLH